MEKKVYFENLRKELELKLKIFDPKTTVKINQAITHLVVVFPPEKTSIFYLEMDVISEAGRVSWVLYKSDHLEVEVRVFYNG